MNINLYILISVLISSLLTFFTSLIFVEGAFKLFNFTARSRALLRLLPFLSVFVDDLLSGISIARWLNPLNCESCVQKIFLTLFYPDLKSYLDINQISLINYLGANLPSNIAWMICLVFGIATGFFILQKFFLILLQAYKLRRIIEKATKSQRPIENGLLKGKLQSMRINVVVSEAVPIPMAANARTIIIPQQVMDTTSQGVFEAIIAHELEHLRWKDPFMRLLSQLISSIIWWIPTKSWHKRMEQDQEIACDSSIVNYGIDPSVLASALVQVVRQAKYAEQGLLCTLGGKSKFLTERIQYLLGLEESAQKIISLALLGVGLELGILLVCLSWL